MTPLDLLGCYLLSAPDGAPSEGERRWACLQEGEAAFLTEVRQVIDAGPRVTCRQRVVVRAEVSPEGWRLTRLMARAKVELLQAQAEVECSAEAPSGLLSFVGQEDGSWWVSGAEGVVQRWAPIDAEEVGQW